MEAFEYGTMMVVPTNKRQRGSPDEIEADAKLSEGEWFAKKMLARAHEMTGSNPTMNICGFMVLQCL